MSGNELDEIQKKSKSRQEKTKPDLIDPKAFEPDYFGKKLVMGCVISSLISVVVVFVVMKIGLSYHEEKIQNISENYESIDRKVKSIVESISDLSTSMDSLKADWKDSKESSSYLYEGIASVQKELSEIKSKLNMDFSKADDSAKNLNSEKSAFIEAFENLIKDGAPFENFLGSYSGKVDLKKYQTFSNLAIFSKQNVKTLSDLKKDFGIVARGVFQSDIEESFWEKQKRVIKEKLLDAIKIRKINDDGSPSEESLSDKSKFENAARFLSDQKFDEAVKIMESLKIEDESFSSLLSCLRKRADLEKAFAEFKKEFLELENSAPLTSADRKK